MVVSKAFGIKPALTALAIAVADVDAAAEVAVPAFDAASSVAVALVGCLEVASTGRLSKASPEDSARMFVLPLSFCWNMASLETIFTSRLDGALESASMQGPLAAVGPSFPLATRGEFVVVACNKFLFSEDLDETDS